VDLIHVFGPLIPRHAFVLARTHAVGKPLILTTFAQLMPHAMKKSRLKKNLYLKAISPWMRSARLLSFGPEEELGLRRYFPRHKIFQATMGVYPSRSAALTPSSLPSNGELRLLFFGRNDRFQKGLDILLEGFLKAAAAGAPVRLTVAGRPWRDSGKYIESFLNRHRLEDRISVVGAEDDENAKWGHYASADYLVYLSRWDGPPRPIREAITAGVPLIVSPETNMGHLVERYGAGVQVPLNPDAVARCFCSLASTPDSRQRFAPGVAALRDRLAWNRVALDYAEIYREVLSGK
jgi:glycosyltransferase involved in cell wall biosynthesis